MDYLVYVAHDAENLQFYLWFQDYKKRFDALKPEERALAPEWNPSESTQDPDQEGERPAERPALGHRKSKSNFLITTKAIELDNSGDVRSIQLGDLTALPPRPLSGNGASKSPAASRTDFETFIARSLQNSKTVEELAEDANTSAGLKWQPCKHILSSRLSCLDILIHSLRCCHHCMHATRLITIKQSPANPSVPKSPGLSPTTSLRAQLASSTSPTATGLPSYTLSNTPPTPPPSSSSPTWSN